jgi:hypothetical protein
MTMMTPDQLRAELACQLNEVLPEGFQATAGWDALDLDAPDGLGTSGWTGQVDGHPATLDSYVAAGWTVLSSVQDCVATRLRPIDRVDH